MWTYLTTPFSFAMPGFRAEELTSWEEQGETWQRLKASGCYRHPKRRADLLLR
jgi:hypothetical protein